MKSKFTNPLRAVIDKIIGEKSRISPEARQSALDCSLSVMALIAAADGTIDESEIVAVQEIYANHGGGIVEAITIRKAFDIVVNDRARAWKQLEAARTLSIDLRESIFAAALQAARADLDLHEDESLLLSRIGEALGIPSQHVQTMLDSQQ